ncbi:MAG: glycosyltransferase [Ginsengibacter sp.]
MREIKKLCKALQKPRILIAPLDWGLGHTTRCIPIIKELIFHGCDVYIVADKQAYSLLKKEFPNTVILRYRGYEIKYSRLKGFLVLKLILQSPVVISRIWKENKWLKKTIDAYSIDAVISDNRFGFYNKNIPSVYITHQLFIRTGNRLTDLIAQNIHYYFIKKYSKCWVPDQEKNGLAGILSHPKNLPPGVTYLGPLSRFKIIKSTNKAYDLLIILSGPEPQRTIFEKLILEQIKDINGNILLIRGLPGGKTKPANFKQVTIENHLPANEMNTALEKSEMVLCRSGYTSVMDLSIMQKKAILVPTPGQTEQEYLAKYLLGKQYFLSEEQENFSIKNAMEKVRSFPFKNPDLKMDEFKKIISEFVVELKSSKAK